METHTIKPPSTSSVAASCYPPWVMLQRISAKHPRSTTKQDSSDGDSDSGSAADPNTLATARATNGYLVGVSFRLAAPPAISDLWVQILSGIRRQSSALVLAAHGDSVMSEDLRNYFVYNAGSEPARPPSLLLLPPYFLPEAEIDRMFCMSRGPVQRRLRHDATGLLHRGQDELIVVELQAVTVGKGRCKQKVPTLLVFRSGEWSVKKPLVRYGNGEDRELLPLSWRTDTVFAVDERTLCWVDSSDGVIFCNVLDESLVLRYVPLPQDPDFYRRLVYRNVCATAGGMVKFVNIFPRCCCGSAGASYCCHSINAYTITSWTLRMDDGMSWVMDGMIDSTELWSLDAYKGLPRIMLAYPVFAMDESHLIYFVLCHDFHVQHGDETVWLITVDMRSKTMPSVLLHPGGRQNMIKANLIPCKVSDCFNSYPNHRNNGGKSLSGNTSVGNAAPVNVPTLDTSVQSSSKTCAEPAMQVSAFLDAFKEIRNYGLTCNDMLKAYSILSDDNCHRFKSLLGLPKNLRKDWLLMEIKSSET